MNKDESIINPVTTETNLPKWIVEEMVAYLYTNGLVIKKQTDGGVLHVPIVPKQLFEKIEFYQIAFNKIIDRMSRDTEFLHSTLNEISQSDEFVRRNLEISKKAISFINRQDLQLGIYRNDFMVDKIKKFIYQIEINTIASSMGTFSDGVKKFFIYFSKKYPEYYQKYFDHENNDYKIPLEKENVISKISSAMSLTLSKFNSENPSRQSIVVFIVQDEERNEYDQRSIENQLWEKHGVYTRRLTLNEFYNNVTYDEKNNLILENKCIALVYFRAGYTEKDYINEECWKAREMIELSTAVKCPSMDTYLCTFKVFQYQLHKPEILMKYIPEELIANDLKRFFVKIYFVNEMSEEQRIQIYKEIREDITKYIVKPQKEGGGNNYYNEEILKILPEEGSSEITEHLKNSLIMERINPPEVKTSLLHNNILKTLKTISEISVYGIILSNTDRIWLNETAGFLIRTKENTSQEGGVIVGVSAIDLPHLVNVPLDKNCTEPLKFD